LPQTTDSSRTSRDFRKVPGSDMRAMVWDDRGVAKRDQLLAIRQWDWFGK